MPTLQDWISQNRSNRDVVAPIKACAGGALRALLKSRRRPAPVAAESRLMRRGAERC